MPVVYRFPTLRRGLFQRARAFDDKKGAPSEFVIFDPGNNPGDDGAAIFDEKAARDCLALYRQRNVKRLTIDYNHKSIDPKAPPEDQKAAGWFTPEVRPGPTLWATNVNWTEAAKRGIEQKEWLYISPVFSKDDDGRITSIVNLAITNNPATWGARPLVAASLGGFSRMDPKIVMLYACLLAVAGGGDSVYAPIATEALDKVKTAAGDSAAALEAEAQAALAADAAPDSTVTAAAAEPPAPAPEGEAARACGPDATPRAADMPAASEEEKRAARGLNPDAALLLFRAAAGTSDDGATKRAATIAAAEKDGILPKAGTLAVWARSCSDADLDKYLVTARASGVRIRQAAAKPVTPKNPSEGAPGAVSRSIDPHALKIAARQAGVDQKAIEARILANREKAAKEQK